MSKVKIYMGIPSTGTRCDSQTYALREIERKYGDKVELVYPKNASFRIFHDFARNMVVKEFLESDCDILWFLDSDVSPPTDIMSLVVEHGDKWLAAGAPYPVWMTQKMVFTCYGEGEKPGHLKITEVPQKGTAFVKGLATGCLFLRREVFDMLEAPYFEFKYDPETREPKEGEDLGFCMKLNKLGLEFFTDFSLVCKHYKQLELLDVNNYTIEYANEKVKAYDERVRTQVNHLVQEVSALRQQNNALREALAHQGSSAPRQTASGLIIPGK